MKSEVASFRLDKKLLSTLKNESKKQNLSLNSHVNQILNEHLEWHSTAPKRGQIPTPTSILKNLLKGKSESEIRRIATIFAEGQYQENKLVFYDDADLETTLDGIRIWSKVAGFTFTKKEKTNHIRVGIKHDCGKNFSILVETIIQKMLENLARAEFTITTNAVTFQVEV